jgi:hypothetical protein
MIVVVAVLVPPLPVFLLLILVPAVEVIMIPMGFGLPPLVIDHLSTPGMTVMVVGIGVPRMHRAS